MFRLIYLSISVRTLSFHFASSQESTQFGVPYYYLIVLSNLGNMDSVINNDTIKEGDESQGKYYSR